MPKSSRLDQKIDKVEFKVKVAGSEVPEELQIGFISVTKHLNRISTARIEIQDGNSYSTKFKIIEEKSYEVGKDVEISIGYKTQVDLIFKGKVVKHGVKINSNKSPKIVIECSDECIKLTGQREFEIFEEMKDSAIIQKLANDKGVSVSCDSTIVKHQRVVQQNTTAWDFIVARAQMNYMVVTTDNGELKVVKPSSGARNELKTSYGDNIKHMDISIDGKDQLLEVETSSWDYKKQENVTGESKEPSEVDKLGNLKGKKMASDLGYKKSRMYSTGKMDSNELKDWAKSALLISRLSRVRGRIVTQGFAKIDPNDFLTIEEVGKYFDGEAYVSGVNHTQKNGDWTTEIVLGIKPDFFVSSKKDVNLPIADGLFPGYTGLLIGKVLKTDGDPDGENRVLVQIPMLGSELKSKGVWARVSNIMASQDFGSFFYPEEDDEVVIGTLGGDLRFPVVLGHLYSSARKPAGDFKHSNKNHEKGWLTREKMLFHFDDKDKIIRIETPGGQKFKLDDKDKSITLEDQHKNKMVMDSSGFKLTGNKDFVVDVKGKVEIKAMGNISAKTMMGNFDAESKASTVKGTMSATLDGATANVKGSMMASVKAGMVMIN